MKLEEAYERWYAIASKDGSISMNSLNSYDSVYKKYVAAKFGLYDVKDIIPRRVEVWLKAKLEDGVNRSTLQIARAVLQRVLAYAREELGAKVNMKHFRIQWGPRQMSPRDKEYTEEEVLKIYEYLKNTKKGDCVAILLCLLTDIKLNEVCALRWEDIDLRHGRLTINKEIVRIREAGTTRTYTKMIEGQQKKNIRRMEMPKKMVRILRPMMKVMKPQWYVVTGDTKPIEMTAFRYRYKKILLNDIGMQRYMAFADFRHRFAMLQIEREENELNKEEDGKQETEVRNFSQG